jgi:hypothetical protein
MPPYNLEMAASAEAERNELNVLTGRPNSTSVSSAKLKSSPKIRVRIKILEAKNIIKKLKKFKSFKIDNKNFTLAA